LAFGREAARKRAERALTVGAGEVARTSISMGILFSPRPGRGAPAGDHVHPPGSLWGSLDWPRPRSRAQRAERAL